MLIINLLLDVENLNIRKYMFSRSTKPFQITVGVRQGSTLSPIIFNLVLVTVSAHMQYQPPWLMMYTDNIALIDENRLMLERKVNLVLRLRTVVLN